MAHATSIAYWRLFYLLPFPLCVGVVASELLSRKELERQKGLRGVIPATMVGLVSMVLMVLVCVPGKHNILRNNLLTMPKEKADPVLKEQILAIMKCVPPGPMLAPRDISRLLVIYSSDYPQVAIRMGDLERILAAMHEDGEFMQKRFNAVAFVSGDMRYASDFRSLLGRTHLTSIVMTRGIYEAPETARMLENRFRFVGSIDGKVILVSRATGRR